MVSSCCSRLIICDRHDRQSSSSCLGFENHSWMQSVWKTCLHTSARLHATTILDIWKAHLDRCSYTTTCLDPHCEWSVYSPKWEWSNRHTNVQLEEHLDWFYFLKMVAAVLWLAVGLNPYCTKEWIKTPRFLLTLEWNDHYESTIVFQLFCNTQIKLNSWYADENSTWTRLELYAPEKNASRSNFGALNLYFDFCVVFFSNVNS